MSKPGTAPHRLHGPFQGDALAVESAGKQVNRRYRRRIGQLRSSEHLECSFGDHGSETAHIDDSVHLRQVSLADGGEARREHEDTGGRILKKQNVIIRIVVADDAA